MNVRYGISLQCSDYEADLCENILFFFFLMFSSQELAAECQSEGHSGVLVPFKCDLSSEEEILSMFAAIKAQHLGVDVCINSAGLAHPESLLQGKTSGWKNMLDVRS